MKKLLFAALLLASCTKTNYLATFPIGHAVEVKGNHDNFEAKDFQADNGHWFRYPAYVSRLDLPNTTPQINFYIVKAADSAEWHMDVSNLRDLGERK